MGLDFVVVSIVIIILLANIYRSLKKVNSKLENVENLLSKLTQKKDD